MTANMYRVGDYVYFENSSTSPFLIRRIEELNKTPNGNVEAKVMCFFRRRDLPNPLVQLADKHQVALEEEVENQKAKTDSNDPCLNSKQRHQLKHRELFLSRQVETIPATHIRGKCSVTLLNETESLLSYLNKDDTFFYCLVFDPSQKTLLADKGEIRVGGRYQVDPAQMPKELEIPENDSRKLEDLETLVWTPNHNLSDRLIDQFLVISRSVGTFARALDCSSSVKQPSLHMSAAAASRDITLFHAMDTLHKHNYDLTSAVSALIPSTGPVLCRDEMEEWSASEANLFEEALEKYGKDFNDIRQDFLPWKTLKNMIEFYYMWKTTDRYVQQKRVKAVEAESKLKQVYIPNYNKPNSAVINNNKGVVNGNSNGEVAVSGKACESCNVTSSSQWYAWGPSHMQCKLCHNCWQYWKKYGGLKVPSRIGEGENEIKKKSGSISDEDSVSERAPSSLASHRPHRCSIIGCGKEFKLKTQLARHYATVHGLAVRAGSPRPIMKTRSAFYLHTTPLTRISRRLCRQLMQTRHAARAPFWAINVPAIKQECQVQMAGKSLAQLKELLIYRPRDRGSVTAIATRLGQYKETVTPEWLILTDKDKMPKAEIVAFPKPPSAPDGSLLYERVPNKPEAEKIPLNNVSPHLKRRIDEVNGMDDSDWEEGTPSLHPGPPPKRSHKDPQALANVAQLAGLNPNAMVPFAPYTGPRQIISHNGKARIAVTRTGLGSRQVLSWMEAPEEVLFRSTEHVKKVRRQLSTPELRRAARKPWRKLSVKGLEDMVVVLD